MYFGSFKDRGFTAQLPKAFERNTALFVFANFTGTWSAQPGLLLGELSCRRTGRTISWVIRAAVSILAKLY